MNRILNYNKICLREILNLLDCDCGKIRATDCDGLGEDETQFIFKFGIFPLLRVTSMVREILAFLEAQILGTAHHFLFLCKTYHNISRF